MADNYDFKKATHVAIILLWYPLFTQPFIFQEIEHLRKYLPLQVFSLYGRYLKHCSQAMTLAANQTYCLGVKALLRVVLALFSYILWHPVKFCQLCRKFLFRRWQNLEIFAENLWAFSCGFLLAKLIKQGGFDAIYAPWPRGTATAAYLVSELTQIPFAIAARGDNLEPQDPDLVDKLKAATFIRANNYADQARIKALIPDAKIAMVYNSLTLQVPKQLAKIALKRPWRLCAIGRFDVTKGFDLLLQACAILKEQQVDFHLTLVGSGGAARGLGTLDQSISNLRTELHLENEVSLPGILSQDAIPSLLQEQDIFIAPCVIDAKSGKRDGIPNTVIEAMTHGLAIVASDVNALPEVIQHEQTGLLVPSGEIKPIADAIIRLGNNRDLARSLGRQASQLAREIFNSDKNTQNLAKVFNQYFS